MKTTLSHRTGGVNHASPATIGFSASPPIKMNPDSKAWAGKIAGFSDTILS